MCEENINCTNITDPFIHTQSQCPLLTERDTGIIESLEYWMSKILPLFLASFGGGTNIFLGLVIFKLQKMRHDVYQLLLAVLLLSDCLYLILRIVDISKLFLPMVSFTTMSIIGDVMFYSLQRFAISFSTFMTVGITLERFIVVHTPIR